MSSRLSTNYGQTRVIVSNLAYSWPAARFRSNWMAVIVHGVEGLSVLVLTLAVILGFVTG